MFFHTSVGRSNDIVLNVTHVKGERRRVYKFVIFVLRNFWTATYTYKYLLIKPIRYGSFIMQSCQQDLSVIHTFIILTLKCTLNPLQIIMLGINVKAFACKKISLLYYVLNNYIHRFFISLVKMFRRTLSNFELATNPLLLV